MPYNIILPRSYKLIATTGSLFRQGNITIIYSNVSKMKQHTAHLIKLYSFWDGKDNLDFHYKVNAN